jgi:opacity protein-like surface antigen
MAPRVLFRVAVLLAAVTCALALAAQAPAAQAPETVGIRLVDAPTNRQDDPRAREYIIDHLAPGTTISRRVEVSNDTSKQVVVQLYAAAADISGGEFHFGEGHAANDLTQWTTLNPASVTLAPGAKSQSAVSIAVPKDASPGERYGVVWAELPAAVATGGGISAVNRVGVRIYLSIGPGGEPPVDFEITALEARRASDGAPTVAAIVHNTGGRALDLGGELRLSDGPGGLSAGPFNAQLGRTLGIGQTEPVLVPLDRAIPAGPWNAHIALRSGLLERTASAKLTFPTKPASASGPVKPAVHTAATARWVVLAVVLVAGLLLLSVVGRRRRHEEAEVQE